MKKVKKVKNEFVPVNENFTELEQIEPIEKTEVPEPETDLPKSENLQSELDAILGEGYTIPEPGNEPETETEPKKRKRKNEPQILIPGKLVVSVTDKLVSRLIVTLDSLVTKSEPLNPKLLEIGAENIDELVPLADEMVKSWKLSTNPTLVFFGSFLLIQITNYSMIKALMSNEKK